MWKLDRLLTVLQAKKASWNAFCKSEGKFVISCRWEKSINGAVKDIEPYREKNQVDKEKDEPRAAKPEEIITRLNHRGTSHHITFLLDS